MINFFIGFLIGGFFGFMACAILAITDEDRGRKK